MAGDKRLVAYVTTHGDNDGLAERLRAHLRAALPNYMVPAQYVLLEALPLTANGKVDKKALPAPDAMALQGEFVAPATGTERSLAAIWAELLHLDAAQIGGSANFFELGGHSLLVIQLLSRLQQAGLHTDVRTVFGAASLGALASTLDAAAPDSRQPFAAPPNLIGAQCTHITPELLPLVELSQDEIDRVVATVPGGAANVQDIYPLAPLQEGILFHYLMQGENDPYVLPMLLSVETDAQLQRFLAALQFVIERHDVLRTALVAQQAALPVQVVYRHAALAVTRLALDADDHNPTRPAGHSPTSLAYVIYTSGSTGLPKGVMVEHQGIMRLVINPSYTEVGPASVFLQLSSTAFDAATFEIWGALLNGGQLVLYPHAEMELDAINEQISQHQVTTIWLTAALFDQWSHRPATNGSLQWVLAGGDVLNPHAVERVYSALANVTVINGYGPTENTTFTCCYPIPRGMDANRPVPLGKVISGTTAYVLGAQGQLAPYGVIGELCTGGAGLARGYLNREDLTAERFIANPYFDPVDAAGSTRLYRTGDLARYLPDGNLEYLGRIDEQVKIRGFRIELGEIEIQLARHAQVHSVVVLAREDEQGDKRLVAYVTTHGEPEGLPERLKSHLRAVLPDYMVPALYVLLDALPLTSNGKVDKQALPIPAGASQLGEFVAPASATERDLAAIWAVLLQMDVGRIGSTANFFELGGDSLKLIRLLSELRVRFAIEVSVKSVFAGPDIARIAQTIDTQAQKRRIATELSAVADDDVEVMEF